jgi:hypothetical protein
MLYGVELGEAPLCKSTNRLKKDLARDQSTLGADGAVQRPIQNQMVRAVWSPTMVRCMDVDDELRVRIGESIYDHLLCEP